MESTHSTDKKARSSLAVFAEPGLLGLVLSFAGRNEHIFHAGVARTWRNVLLLQSPDQLPATKTSVQTVVVSVARLLWAMDCGLRWGDELVRAAAYSSTGIKVLKWSVENGFLRPQDGWGSPGHTLCRHAAAAGHLETLQWARQNGFHWDSTTCLAAAECGHLQLLQWARVNGLEWDDEAPSFAAMSGHLAMCRWLHDAGCPFNMKNVSWSAAEGGHWPVLAWLRDTGTPFDATTCYKAALGGRLDLLKKLRENNCPWDVKACKGAASANSLKTLQWLRDNGCPWNADTCFEAAQYGYLDILRYARDNGCPWDRRVCDIAASDAELNAALLEWIHANDSPCGCTPERVAALLAGGGDDDDSDSSEASDDSYSSDGNA